MEPRNSKIQQNQMERSFRGARRSAKKSCLSLLLLWLGLPWWNSAGNRISLASKISVLLLNRWIQLARAEGQFNTQPLSAAGEEMQGTSSPVAASLSFRPGFRTQLTLWVVDATHTTCNYVGASSAQGSLAR
jgi:hypothetical protein